MQYPSFLILVHFLQDSLDQMTPGTKCRFLNNLGKCSINNLRRCTPKISFLGNLSKVSITTLQIWTP